MRIGLGLEQIRARKRTDWTAATSSAGVAQPSVTSDHHIFLNDHPSEAGDPRSGQTVPALLRHRRLMYRQPGGFTSHGTKLLNTIRRRKHLLQRGRIGSNLSARSASHHHHHHHRSVRTVADFFPKRLFKGPKLAGKKKCSLKRSIEKQTGPQKVDQVESVVPVSVEAREEPEIVSIDSSDQSGEESESKDVHQEELGEEQKVECESSEVEGAVQEEKQKEAVNRATLIGELKKDLKEYCSVRWTFRLVLSMLQERLEELERSVDETNDGADVDQSNSRDSAAEATNQQATTSSAAAPASADTTTTGEVDLSVISNQKELKEEHVERNALESSPSPGEALDDPQGYSSPKATPDGGAASEQKRKSGYTPLKTSKTDILDPTYTCEIQLEPLEERKASFVDSLLDKFNLPPPTMPLTNGFGGDGGDDGMGEQSQQSRRCLRDRTKIAARPRYIEIPEEPRRVRVSKVFGKLHKSLNLDLDSTNSNSSTEFYGFDEGEVVKLDKPSLPGLLPTPIVKKSQPYAPFLAYGTPISDKEEDSRCASPSSTVTIRSDLLRENGLLSYGSHPPRLQCPLRPSDMIRPRTVAQKRILLEHLSDVRYPMIDNESKIYRFLMMKTRNQDEQLDFERMKELQDQPIPFTRGTWRALSWLRTEKDRYNFQAICIDGRWTKLMGCRGNHPNKLLMRKKVYSGVVKSSGGRRIHYINNCRCPAHFPPGVTVDLSPMEPPKSGAAIFCASKKQADDDDERKMPGGRPKLLPDRSQEYQNYRSFPDTKPGPLSSKRLPPSAFEQDPYLGPLEIFEMPTVELEVFPKIDRPLDGIIKPYLKMILPYSGITENWARFAVSTLRSTRGSDVLPGEDGERSFIFQLPYANDERRLLIRRRLITRPGEATVVRTSGRGGFGAADLEQFEQQLEQRLTFREAIDCALEKEDSAIKTAPVDEDERICADVLSELTNSVAITIAEELFVTDDPDLDYREEEPDAKPLLPEQKKDNAGEDDKKMAIDSKGTLPPTKAVTDSVATEKPAPECSKPATKSKLLREMKRLNATIIQSPSQPALGGTGGRDSSATDPSAKSVHRPCDPVYCAKGCICDVLGGSMSAQATVSESRTSHCQRIECVLGCVCGYEQKMVNHTHEVKIKRSSEGGGEQERSSLTSADVKYLREKATARLAKEEREFTPTVILTDNATVLVRNTESETRRQKKKPKKYDDYYNENSMQKLLSGRFGFEDCVPATPPQLPSEEMALQVKPLSLPDRMRHAHVILYNLSALTALEPWCMVHQLYRCYCGGTATQGKPFSFLEENCVEQTSWESSSPSTTATNSPSSSGNNNTTSVAGRMSKMMITNGSSNLLLEPKKEVDSGNAASLPYLAPLPRKRLYSFEKISPETAPPRRPGRPPHTSICSSGGSARKRESSEESYKPPGERRVKRRQKANTTTTATTESLPTPNGVGIENGPRRKGIMRRRFSTGDWIRPRQLRKMMEEQQQQQHADAQYKIVARPAPKAGISNIVLKRIPQEESPPKPVASPPKRLTNGIANRDAEEPVRSPIKPSPPVSQTAQIVMCESSEDEHLPVVEGRRKQKFTSSKAHAIRRTSVPSSSSSSSSSSNSLKNRTTSVTTSPSASSTNATTSKTIATTSPSSTNTTASTATKSPTSELAPTLVVTQRQLRELIEREKAYPSPVRTGQRRLQNVHLVDPNHSYDLLRTPTMRLVICGFKKAFVDVRMLRRPGVLDNLVSHSSAMVYIVKIPINTIPSACPGDVVMKSGCAVPPVANASRGRPSLMPPATVGRILDRRHSIAHVRTPSGIPCQPQQQQQQQLYSAASSASRHDVNQQRNGPHEVNDDDDDDDDENSGDGITPPKQAQILSLMRHVSTLLSRDTPCLSQVKAGILHICRWTALTNAFAIGQADVIDVTYNDGNRQTLIWINRRHNAPLLVRNYKSYTSARHLWQLHSQCDLVKYQANLQSSVLHRMVISSLDSPESNRHLGLILYGGLHYWLFCGFIKTPKDRQSLPLAAMKAALPIKELTAFNSVKSSMNKSHSPADTCYERSQEESQIEPEPSNHRSPVPPSSTTTGGGGMPKLRVIPTSSLLEKNTGTTMRPSTAASIQGTKSAKLPLNRSSNIDIAPACPSTDGSVQDRSRHCRWIKLHIVDDFTDMYIPAWRYCIQYSQLMEAIQHANRHRAVRCLEFTLSTEHPVSRTVNRRPRTLPCIYAAPYQDNSIYIGPFHISQTQVDIMLCVASDGLLYTREEHERQKGIVIPDGANRTRGLWIEMPPEAMDLLQRQLDRTRLRRNGETVPRSKASTCYITPAMTYSFHRKPPTIIGSPVGTAEPVRSEPNGGAGTTDGIDTHVGTAEPVRSKANGGAGTTDGIDTHVGTAEPVRSKANGGAGTTDAAKAATTSQRSLLKRSQPVVTDTAATTKPPAAEPGAVAECKPTIIRKPPIPATVRRVALAPSAVDRPTVVHHIPPKKLRVDDNGNRDDDDDDEEIEKDGDDYERRKNSDIKQQQCSSSGSVSAAASLKEARSGEPDSGSDGSLIAPVKNDDTDRLAQLLEQTMQYTEQEQRKVEHLIKSSRPKPEEKVTATTETSVTPPTEGTAPAPVLAVAKSGQDGTIVVPPTMNRKRKSVDVMSGSGGGDGGVEKQQPQQSRKLDVPIQAKFIRISDATHITTKEIRSPISIVSTATAGAPSRTVTLRLNTNGFSKVSLAPVTPDAPITSPVMSGLQRTDAPSRVSLPLPIVPASSAVGVVQAVAKPPATEPRMQPTTQPQLATKPSGSEAQLLRQMPMVRRNSVVTMADFKKYTGKYKIIIPPKPTSDAPATAGEPNPNAITGKIQIQPTESSSKIQSPAEGTSTPRASTAASLEAKSASLAVGQTVSSGQEVNKKNEPAAPRQHAVVGPSSSSAPSTSTRASVPAVRNRKRPASNATARATVEDATNVATSSSSSSTAKRSQPGVRGVMSSNSALSSILPETEATMLSNLHKKGVLVSNIPNLGMVEVVRMQIEGQLILRLPELTSQKRSVVVPNMECAVKVLNEFIQLNTYAFLPSNLKIIWTFHGNVYPVFDSKKLRSIINQRCVITKYGIVDFSAKGKLEEFESAIARKDPNLLHQVLALRLTMLCYPKVTYEKHKDSWSQGQVVTRAAEIIGTLTQSAKAKLQEKAFYKNLVEENKLKLAQLSKRYPKAAKQSTIDMESVVVIDDDDDDDEDGNGGN